MNYQQPNCGRKNSFKSTTELFDNIMGGKKVKRAVANGIVRLQSQINGLVGYVKHKVRLFSNRRAALF